MIKDNDLYGIKHYLYGEAYYGSDSGMRFRLAREPLKNVVYCSEEERKADDPKLRAEAWFGLLSYEKTKEEEIEKKDFEFSESGYKEAVAWLNRVREEHGQ